MPNLETKLTIGPVIFDLETNGLLLNTTCIHCACLYYTSDDYSETFNDEKIGKACRAMWLEQSNTFKWLIAL